VLAARLQLTKHLTPKPTDSEAIADLKKNVLFLLHYYLKVNPLHNVALILDPRLKSNHSLMTVTERQQALTDLKQLVREIPHSVIGNVSRGIVRWCKILQSIFEIIQ
jgi:hypothetical protein